MGWERRTRGGLYYTRSRKVDGRVIREYVGGGLLGEFAATADAERCAVLKAQSEAWRAEQSRLDLADAPLNILREASDAMVRRSLMHAGYYQHNRGEWRKRRGKIDCSSE
jgi:hypothetical protein